MKNGILVYLGAIILIITLGVWGYYLYNQRVGSGISRPTPSLTQNQQTADNKTQASPQNIFFAHETSLLTYADLPSPTQDQNVKFFEALQEYAIPGEEITISKCKATPTALKVKLGKDIKVTNNNNVEYTLIRSTKQYSLPANQTITIKSDFGVGAHGFRCGGMGFENQPVAGYFYVIE